MIWPEGMKKNVDVSKRIHVFGGGRGKRCKQRFRHVCHQQFLGSQFLAQLFFSLCDAFECDVGCIGHIILHNASWNHLLSKNNPAMKFISGLMINRLRKTMISIISRM